MGANPTKKSTWEPVLSNMNRRFAKWKNRQLCLGVEFASSILSSMPYPSYLYLALGYHPCWLKR